MIDHLNEEKDNFKTKIVNRIREMNTVKDFLKTGLAFLKAFYL